MALSSNLQNPASILYKSIADRYRPDSYPDGPITARYRFIKNAYWVKTLLVVFEKKKKKEKKKCISFLFVYRLLQCAFCVSSLLFLISSSGVSGSLFRVISFILFLGTVNSHSCWDNRVLKPGFTGLNTCIIIRVVILEGFFFTQFI